MNAIETWESRSPCGRCPIDRCPGPCHRYETWLRDRPAADLIPAAIAAAVGVPAKVVDTAETGSYASQKATGGQS